MKTLSRGQKIRLAELSSSTQLQVRLECKAGAMGFDFSCFGLDENGKLSDDRYLVFYNQKQSPGNELKLLLFDASAANFSLDVARLPMSVRRLVFVATVDGAGNMSQLNAGRFLLSDAGGQIAEFAFAGRDFISEKAVMVAEIYFKDQWRVAANGQGFKEGLNAVLRHFGGQEIEPAPTLPTQPPAPPRTAPFPNSSPQPPRPAPLGNPANCCSDCGKALSLIERGMSSLSGERRCGACDRAWKQQQQQLQAQQQASNQLALRAQVIRRILSGEMPFVAQVNTGIVLDSGEVCHYITPTTVYEERVTGTVRGGHSALIRRGVAYRAGTTQGKSISTSGVAPIDSGRLLVTNQRWVFDGQQGSFSVALSDLTSFEAFADGIELNLGNQMTQQYKIQDGEMVAAILSSALNA